MTGVSKVFESGIVFVEDHIVEIQKLPWDESALSKGVFLKHLITAKDTDGKFSASIVKITAGHEIGDHVHNGKYELHEVIEGSGVGVLEKQSLTYKPGVMVVVPPDKTHKVTAGTAEDLVLLAKFFPALL